MKISHISLKVATPIILVGLFIITVFISFNYERLDLTFYIIFSLIIVYVFLFGFATGQRFVAPIRKILNRAIDLSKGDLKARAYLESKDELSELAKAFNEIAEKLEQSQNNEEQTEKSVDVKIRARTQALEETIIALEQKIKNRTMELERATESLKKIQNDLKK